MERILKYLPLSIRQAVKGFRHPQTLREIRLRAGAPLTLLGEERVHLDASGFAVSAHEAYRVTADDCRTFYRNITGHSVYALEGQLAQFFLSLPGGVRVGLAGTAVSHGGQLKLIKDCMQFNIRIPRQVHSCANQIIPYIQTGEGVYHTLILSPPGAGKTTLLRDTVRILAECYNVSVIDERSELAAVYQGMGQFDLGLYTDIFDQCPKHEGLMRAIRVMAPDVVVTDEIGEGESEAVSQAARAGVKVIASAHAGSLSELRQKKGYGDILSVFQRFILLSTRLGPGTVEGIYDAEGNRLFGKEAGR